VEPESGSLAPGVGDQGGSTLSAAAGGDEPQQRAERVAVAKGLLGHGWVYLERSGQMTAGTRAAPRPSATSLPTLRAGRRFIVEVEQRIDMRHQRCGFTASNAE
jgi:hypothetical protein